MPNRYLKILLSVLAITALSPLKANAQFYDSDTEVRIYVLDDVINNPGKPVSAFVVNFNGSKAAIIAKSGAAPSNAKSGIMGILEDDSYFEKLVYSSPDVINYNSDKSTYSKVCYTKIRYAPNLYNAFVQDSFTENYYFSSDGNRVIELSGSNWSAGQKKGQTYSRVSKDKLVELILANKNKGSERWR